MLNIHKKIDKYLQDKSIKLSIITKYKTEIMDNR